MLARTFVQFMHPVEWWKTKASIFGWNYKGTQKMIYSIGKKFTDKLTISKSIDTYIVDKYKINLHSLRNVSEMLSKCSLFYSFQKLVHILFFRQCTYIVYIYVPRSCINPWNHKGIMVFGNTYVQSVILRGKISPGHCLHSQWRTS